MKVLVVGSGGREHALCWAIAKSPICEKLFCAPGNGGIAKIAKCVNIEAEAVDELVCFAIENDIGFVVVGPEAPLIAGLVNQLNKAGINAFGPSGEAARIEGSKGFLKDLCAKYSIPTGYYERFDEPDAAKEYILRKRAPIVVKADGLASGKGVIVCRNENEAYAAVDYIMTERAFGKAGDEVVIEEFLNGEEASFFALVNGVNAVSLLSAQDHKAAHDGETGPNTGGMGAYAPAPMIAGEMEKTIMNTIVLPLAEAMAAEGTPYQGVLYAGLMITGDGPKLLEVNARFGDPEAQSLVLLLKSDLLEAMLACVEGRLDKLKLEWRGGAALTVVMAAKGYPGYYEKGSRIKGLEKISESDDLAVFYSDAAVEDSKVYASGGRVLGVSAFGKTVAEAKKRAYQAVDLIDWPEGFCRRDIGFRAIKRNNHNKHNNHKKAR